MKWFIYLFIYLRTKKKLVSQTGQRGNWSISSKIPSICGSCCISKRFNFYNFINKSEFIKPVKGARLVLRLLVIIVKVLVWQKTLLIYIKIIGFSFEKNIQIYEYNSRMSLQTFYLFVALRNDPAESLFSI